MRGRGLGSPVGFLNDGSPLYQDNSGALSAGPPGSAVPPSNIPINAGGGKVQGRGLYFMYQTANIATLAPAASTTNTVIFDQNSVFNWLRTTFSVDKTNAAETVSTLVAPFVTLQITDTGNGMSFMNAPIPIIEMAGFKGELPYVLPTPQLIQANATYQFQFTSFSTAGGGNETYTNLRVQLHGYRIFNNGQQTAS
jgi:hypothetical protein